MNRAQSRREFGLAKVGFDKPARILLDEIVGRI
jgi:hypothetical protein